MKNTVLIGTILSRSKFPHKPLRDIVDILEIKQIFIFEIGKKDQFLLTYNLDKSKISLKLPELKSKYKNTIRLHRKRKNNVLYTINSLNKLEESAKIDWSKFNSCIILLGKEGELSIRDITLRKVIKL